MNPIKHIHGKNIKGQTFDHELTAKNLVISPSNATGKTAILDCIRIALLGYHPTLGKKPQSIFKLSSGRRMDCFVEILNHGTVGISFTESSSGTIKTERHGDADLVPPVMLDPNQFFGLTQNQKTAWLFSLCGKQPDQVKSEALERIKSALAAHVNEGELWDFAQSILSQLDEVKTGDTSDAWVGDAIKNLTDHAKAIRREVQQFKETVQGLTKQAVLDIDKKLNQTTKELSEIDTEIGRLKGKRDSISDMLAKKDQKQLRWSEIEDALKTSEETELPEENPLETLEEKRKLYRNLTNDLSSIQSTVGSISHSLDQTKERLSQLREQLKEEEGSKQKIQAAIEAISHKFDIDITSLDKDQVQENVDSIKQTLESLRASLKEWSDTVSFASHELDRLKQTRGQLKDNGECPTCGTAGHALEAAVANLDKEIEETEYRIERARSEYGTCEKDINQYLTRLSAYEGLLEKIESLSCCHERIQSISESIQSSEEELQSLSKRYEESQTDFQKKQNNLTGLDEEIEKLSSQATAYQSALNIKYERDSLVREKAQIEKDLKEYANLDSVEEIDRKIAELENDREKAKQAYDENVAERKETAMKVEASERHQRKQAELDIVKKASDALNEYFSEVLKGLNQTIFEPANRIAQEVLKSSMVFSNGEIRRTSRGIDIPQAAFSGAEQIVSYAAISYALAVNSMASMRLLLLDEMGVIDKERKTALLTAIEDDIEKENLTQFIGADLADIVGHPMYSRFNLISL